MKSKSVLNECMKREQKKMMDLHKSLKNESIEEEQLRRFRVSFPYTVRLIEKAKEEEFKKKQLKKKQQEPEVFVNGEKLNLNQIWERDCLIKEQEEQISQLKKENEELKQANYDRKDVLIEMVGKFPNIRIRDICWTNFYDFQYKTILKKLKLKELMKDGN